MKSFEIFDDDDRYNVGQDDDDMLFEMSHFKSSVTGLPDNIEIWTRTDPINHGHNRYRIKIIKDKQWAGIYTVGQNPECVKDINQTIAISEDRQIKEFIIKFSSLIIGLIDNKFDTADFITQLLKIQGQ